MSNNTLRRILIAVAVVLTIILVAIGVYAVAFLMLGPMMA